jgi:uncharacterized protein
MTEKIGRNDPCPCGSGKKYKACCMQKQQQSKPGLGKRKFTAKLLSGGGMPKAPEKMDEPQPVDYNSLMERAFGQALHTEDQPTLANPSEFLPKEEEKSDSA